jgi:8-oxo-dGTP pyrophosphatase MutT (NUDIX family)
MVKYGMLGGTARPGETEFQCMSREAKEETGGALTLITLARIAEGRGILDGSKAVRLLREFEELCSLLTPPKGGSLQ